MKQKTKETKRGLRCTDIAKGLLVVVVILLLSLCLILTNRSGDKQEQQKNQGKQEKTSMQKTLTPRVLGDSDDCESSESSECSESSEGSDGGSEESSGGGESSEGSGGSSEDSEGSEGGGGSSEDSESSEGSEGSSECSECSEGSEGSESSECSDDDCCGDDCDLDCPDDILAVMGDKDKANIYRWCYEFADGWKDCGTSLKADASIHDMTVHVSCSASYNDDGYPDQGEPKESQGDPAVEEYSIEKWRVDKNKDLCEKKKDCSDEFDLNENEPPIAVDDYASTPKNTPVTINVLNNDSDPDDNLDPSSLEVTNDPDHGSVSIQNNKAIYTPDNGYVGVDTFNYKVCDTDNLCDSAIVTVTIEDLPPEEKHPPVALNDSAQTEVNTPVTIDVLDNDSDPDDNLDPGSLEVKENPSNGSVEKVGDRFVYTPNNDYAGNDQFKYEVCDTDDLCDTAYVYITIYTKPEEKHPPVANDDAETTQKNIPVTVDVLANDSDPDDNLDPNSLAVISGPDNGSTSIVNGEVLYTPNTDYVGEDQFNYKICDTDNLCDTAIATIIITDSGVVLYPPVAKDDAEETDMNESVDIEVLDNDSDVDGYLVVGTLDVVDEPDDGAVSIDNGEITYLPDEDFYGRDDFKYQICDNDGLCDIATVTIDIISPPIAEDDEETTRFNEPVDIRVLRNDEDPDGELDVDSLEVKEDPDNGTVEIDGSVITYTPNDGFVGDDTFVYEICDEDKLCDLAEVTITVLPEGEEPPEEEEEEEEEFIVEETYQQARELIFGSNQFVQTAQSSVLSNQGVVYFVVNKPQLFYLEAQGATWATVINLDTKDEYPLEYDEELKLWKGELAFSRVGVFELEAKIGNQLETYSRNINFVLVSNPSRVADTSTGQSIPDVPINVYKRDTYTKRFVKWDAAAQGQSNPVIADENGNFSLILKEGEYYLEIDVKGYKKIKSRITQISKKSMVTANIKMEKQGIFNSLFSFVTDRFNENNNFPLKVQALELAGERLEVGREVPSIFAFNKNKEAINVFEQIKLKEDLPLVVLVYSKWNTDAEQQMKIFEEVAKEKARDYNFIALSTMDPFNKTSQALERGDYEIEFYKVSDDFYDDYKMTTLPEVMIIGKNQKLLDDHIGPLSKEQFRELLSNPRGDLLEK